LSTSTLPQLASEAVHLGTVQLPPSGLPVILMGEHQTTGGYPRVLEVASAAFPMLAQAAAGSLIQFHLISLEEADRMSYAMHRLQTRVEQALQTKFGQTFHEMEHRR
jgi:antagonist of KipI